MGEETKNRHSITIDGCSKVNVTGVTDVLSFDEDSITADTYCGAMVIKGRELHVVTLDLEKAVLVLDGGITGVYYEQSPIKTSFFGKILK